MAKISANNAAKSVSLLYFQVCCLANKKVAEEISLRHASNILFLIIQYMDSCIAMYHKPFQSLTGDLEVMIWEMNFCLFSTVCQRYASKVPSVT